MGHIRDLIDSAPCPMGITRQIAWHTIGTTTAAMRYHKHQGWALRRFCWAPGQPVAFFLPSFVMNQVPSNPGHATQRRRLATSIALLCILGRVRNSWMINEPFNVAASAR